MDQEFINPDFKTSIYDIESLAEAEILNNLKKEPWIVQNFKSKGIIHSKQYSFITKATFGADKNSAARIEGKSDEEKSHARKNRKVVENYFNEFLSKDNQVRVEFIERNDDECALYNYNRLKGDRLKKKFEKIFD